MSDWKQRRERLQAMLQEQGLDGFLAVQNVDCYYLCGSMQSGFLFIPAKGDGVFYVRRSVSRAIQEADSAVFPLASLKELGKQMARDFPDLSFDSDLKMATTLDVLPVALYQKLQQSMSQVEWTDGSSMMKKLRMIKSEAEIASIRKAAKAVDTSLQDVLATFRPGWTEVELLANLERELRRHGHFGMMRMRGFNQELVVGMVGSGGEIAEPSFFDGPAGGSGLHPAFPQSASTTPIRRDEPLFIDVGCTIEGYVIDQTRTAVWGRLDSAMERAYLVSEDILRALEQLLKPGTPAEAVYFEALKLAEKAGLRSHFMGYGSEQVKFVGHGIGLEVDEWPVLAKGFKQPLEAGMVIAIEPKFTFPGQGVVGIENTYLITEQGFEKLTCSREGVWHIL
ncbi:M24 family metallopeptidase [Marinicrinis sediminis]|uniref:M24 family metallopeptidase n=1 Tax=Marinicrinis sediminis TaxID=1652465 RepID=A0ABW5RC59_9BACL